MAVSLPNEPDDLLITDELHHRIAHKADWPQISAFAHISQIRNALGLSALM